MKIMPITTAQNRAQKQNNNNQNNPAFNGWVKIAGMERQGSNNLEFSKHYLSAARDAFFNMLRGLSRAQRGEMTEAESAVRDFDKYGGKIVEGQKAHFQFPDVLDPYVTAQMHRMKAEWPTARIEGVLEGHPMQLGG